MSMTPACFEGPEKRLELDFKPGRRGSPTSLRTTPFEEWVEMLKLVNCTVLSRTSNDYVDSFVLSESSLFVFERKIVIKTCGTTTLLACLPSILDIAGRHQLEISFVLFSRRNYLFPDQQQHPHCAFEDEVLTLQERFPDGQAHIIGPITGVHWHLYFADYSDPDGEHDEDQHIEIMMTGLSKRKMAQFFRPKEFDPAQPSAHKQVTINSGLTSVFPGATTDEFMFEPCGYSMNGIKSASYATVHVTPEDHCSFVSYETNMRCGSSTYSKLVTSVFSLFEPTHATVTVFSDRRAMIKTAADSIPTKLQGYRLQYQTSYSIEGGRSVSACNFTRVS